jgi:1,4-dihydroxy-2-naphthoate octaprenyltransferase
VAHPDPIKGVFLFLILYFGIFPASQGYNSFFDSDQYSIGGLERPPPVTGDLYFYSLALEIMALVVAYVCWGWSVVLSLTIYGLFSKAYSHPLIRLKRHPILGFLCVSFLQGAGIYIVCLLALEKDPITWRALFNIQTFISVLISALLIAGSYPLTQIYQHMEDEMRGDLTLSRLLGIRGTFLFSAIVFLSYFLLLALNLGFSFYFWAIGFTALPVLFSFGLWWRRVYSDPGAANFRSAHHFLKLSTFCVNLGFIVVLIGRHFHGL